MNKIKTQSTNWNQNSAKLGGIVLSYISSLIEILKDLAEIVFVPVKIKRTGTQDVTYQYI